MKYPFYVASAGTPYTGHVADFVWSSLNKVSDGSTVSAGRPTFAESAGGWYNTSDYTPSEDLVGVIDCGSSLGASDRYVPLYITAYDQGVKTLVTNVGTPVGASVSADVAALKTDLDTRIPYNLSVSAGGKVAGTLASGDVTGNLPAIVNDSATVDLSAKLTTSISQGAADKVWNSSASLNSDLKTNLASAIWDELVSVSRTALSLGAKIKNWALGTDNKVLISTDVQDLHTTLTVAASATVSGTVNANLIQIDGNATNGFNATLNLKKLIIDNTAASDGTPAVIINGSGDGIRSTGGNHGVNLIGTGNEGLTIGHGVYIGAGNYTALQIDGKIDSPSIVINRRGTGDGVCIFPLNTPTGKDYNVGEMITLEANAATAATKASSVFNQVGLNGSSLINLGDTRIAHLDADVSSRATDVHVLAIPTAPLLASDSRLNNLDHSVADAASQAGSAASAASAASGYAQTAAAQATIARQLAQNGVYYDWTASKARIYADGGYNADHTLATFAWMANLKDSTGSPVTSATIGPIFQSPWVTNA